MADRLQALVQQWRYINDLITQIEGQFLSVPLVVLTVIAAGRIYVSGGDGTGAVLISAITIGITAAVIAYLAFLMWRVAVVRGYIWRLEREINSLADEGDFSWSSGIARRYLGNSWMNILIFFAVCIPFAVVCGMSLATLIAMRGLSLWVLVLLLASAVVVVMSVCALLFNGKVSDAVRDEKPVGIWCPWRET